MRKAGQLEVTVVDDSVGMTPFEEHDQPEAWVAAVQEHFNCTLAMIIDNGAV
jgi:hypothetical protein